MTKTIAVIAAHPDDEVLGCGGTIAAHTQKGDKVHTIILAEGITSRNNKRDPLKQTFSLLSLSESAQRANNILGVSSLSFHNFPDNRMDSVDLLDVVKVVERYINKIKPDLIYTHHWGDLNIDHRITNEAVITACRPVPGCFYETILFFEVVSSTEWQVSSSQKMFSPNWYVDITHTLDIKIDALKAYSSEMRDWPHPRSIESVKHLARLRGSSIGCDVAEAFMLGRHIKK